MKFQLSGFRLLISILFIIIICPSNAYETRIGINCTADKERKFCGDELICLDGQCSFCRNNSDCLSKYSTNQCREVRDFETNDYAKL